MGGWNGALGCPKPQERVLVAGSTVRVEPHRPLTAADLVAVQDTGLGLRTHEGFGWISVNPSTWRRSHSVPVVESTSDVPSEGELLASEQLVTAVLPEHRGPLVDLLKSRAEQLERSDFRPTGAPRWMGRVPDEHRRPLIDALKELDPVTVDQSIVFLELAMIEGAES